MLVESGTLSKDLFSQGEYAVVARAQTAVDAEVAAETQSTRMRFRRKSIPQTRPDLHD
jgi:hypothetical protein